MSSSKNKIIFVSVLLGLLAFICFNKSNKYFNTNQTRRKPNSINTEFCETSIESKQIKTIMDASLVIQAFKSEKGEKAALYVMGLHNLFGGVIPVNIKLANMYFAKSASLGFAPALNKLRFKYVEDEPNLFLALVYLNLTISMGHNELTQLYHHLLNNIKHQFGYEIASEIEKIASQKHQQILKLEEQYSKAANKEEFVLKMIDITMEDSIYDNQYFENIFIKK